MARTAKKLTKAALDTLRREAEADPEFSAYRADAGQPGLAAWARRGRVRFVFEYEPPKGGPRRRMQIDDFGAITLEQAREVALKYRGKVAAGLDPQDERTEAQRRAVTVEEAVKGYLADLKSRAESGAGRGKRSGYSSAKRRLERNVVPKLGSKRIRDVGSDAVRRLHRSMESTPVEANRTLTALSAVFGWADRAEVTPARFNPCRHVERFAETGERRAFTRKELEALGAVLEEASETGSVPLVKDGKPQKDEDGKAKRSTIHPSAALAIRFLALTGFRRSELLGHTMKDRRGRREGLRWGDVDLDAGLVRLRDTKSGAQTRVLGEVVVELLREAKPSKARDTDPVCPGTVEGQPFIGIDKARKRLWGAAGLKGVDLHSLRHTFASIGAHVQAGRFSGHVSALLGHGYQSRAITERYITSDPEGLRPAADAISKEISVRLGLLQRGRVLEFGG